MIKAGLLPQAKQSKGSVRTIDCILEMVAIEVILHSRIGGPRQWWRMKVFEWSQMLFWIQHQRLVHPTHNNVEFNG